MIQGCTIASNIFAASGTPPLINPNTYGILLDNFSALNVIDGNQVGYHTTCGIIDTATPVSSSFFIRNISSFNSLNYSATVRTDGGVGTGPIPAVIVYPGNFAAYTGGGPIFENVDVRL